VNKAELVNAISMRYGYTRKEATKQLDQILDVIIHVLPKYGSIKIRGFGTFNIVERQEKTMINPKTKEHTRIPRRNILTFTPSKQLKNDIQEYGDINE
jgi:DNA-binding protein HU-beta